MTELSTWKDRSYGCDGGDDIYILWETGEGGYDWWIEALLAKRVGDRVGYAIYSDSGCSCSSDFEGEPEGFIFNPNLDTVMGELCNIIRGTSDWRMASDERVSNIASLKQLGKKIRAGEVTIP